MPDAIPPPPPQPGFEISVASQGMSQGILQTGGLQFFGRAFVRMGAVQAGAQYKNVDSRSADGVGALFAKIRWKMGKLQLDTGAAYRIRIGASSHVNAWEFSAAATRTLGTLSLRAYGEYSADEFGHGPSLFGEAGPRLDIARSLQVSANIGFHTLRGAPDYAAFNAGLRRTMSKGVSFDARVYGTSKAAHGSPYRARLILSIHFTS